MENEKKEKLSNFLLRRAERDVLSRGRSIYSSGGLKVSKLDYNGPGNAEFKVKSDYSDSVLPDFYPRLSYTADHYRMFMSR